jgi:hypothetical protein
MKKKDTKRHLTRINSDAVRETLPTERIGDDVVLIEDVSKVPFFS